MSYANIAAAVFGRPWFVTEQTMTTITDLVSMRQAGTRLATPEIRDRLDAAVATQGPREGQRTAGAVAVIPVYGTLMHRANLFTDFSGGTTYQGLARALRQALADDSVASILFDVDSPGGELGGCDELASEIRAARGRKPMVSVINTLGASGGYYLACQADEIVATPTSLTGSIGCVIFLQEASRALDEAGITTTVIRRPDSKAKPNEYEALDADTQAYVQQICDDGYALFVNAVAKARGVTTAAVKAGYGEGRVLTAKRALEAGLVDRVASFDETVARMASGKFVAAPTGARAESEEPFTRIELDVPVELPADVADEVHHQSTEAQAAIAIARARAQH